MGRIVGLTLIALALWAAVYAALIAEGVPDGLACLSGIGAELAMYQACIKPAINAYVK